VILYQTQKNSTLLSNLTSNNHYHHHHLINTSANIKIMPFFGFNQRSSAATNTALEADAHHHRKQSSLSLSSSHKDALAAIKAQTVAMANSGELTLSRSKTSSGHTRSSSSGQNRSVYRKPTGGLHVNQRSIVVVEPDEDSSKHTKRIDQGILDASREALDVSRQKEVMRQQQQQQPSAYASWWSSLAYYGGAQVVSPGPKLNVPGSEQIQQQQGESPVLGGSDPLQCKTTVSRKFRVP
jgi:hypothetical protein